MICILNVLILMGAIQFIDFILTYEFNLCFRTKTLEEELAKCRCEISSLEKELSEALQNNLLEYSNRSSSNIISKLKFNFHWLCLRKFYHFVNIFI